MSIALTNNFKAVQRKDPKSVAIHILLDLCTYVQVVAGSTENQFLWRYPWWNI